MSAQGNWRDAEGVIPSGGELPEETIRRLRGVEPTYRQYLVTIPGEAAIENSGDDIQVLVREWDSGQVEADFRPSADCAVTWRPVELLGGKVERA